MVPHSLEKMAYVPQRSAVPPAQFVMEDTAWREYYYPPFASIAKGEVFVFTFAVLFVFCQRFLDNPLANSRQILHAGVLWFWMCLLPFWGLAAPGGRKKRGNEIFVTMGVNGEFLHFGGFWAISQQRLHVSTPNIICVGTMSADVPPPPVVPIGPWGGGGRGS